jgi:stearoyl-CoA desaturase (delta-9 desaturase)
MIEFSFGLLPLPWWGYPLVLLAMTHVTIVSVTLYLHRAQAHRAVRFHPLLSHGFRFWLWLTTGMRTGEWVAIHRRHHARVETAEDPHSPHVAGISTVFWQGAELYRDALKRPEILAPYRQGTPDDWLERHVYTAHNTLGISLMLILQVALFGLPGLSLWALQMIWIPFWAAGVINGLGHWSGYRNFETPDGSTNLLPWAIWIGGEELHNNHHAYPSSARFSMRSWEFDLGWAYLRLFSALKLARIVRLAPRPSYQDGEQQLGPDAVRAIIKSRLHVLRHYSRSVIKPVWREELRRSHPAGRRVIRQVRKLLVREESRIDDAGRARLADVLRDNARLKHVVELRRELQAIWNLRGLSTDGLLLALLGWCREAEASGIDTVQQFARQLKSYRLTVQLTPA